MDEQSEAEPLFQHDWGDDCEEEEHSDDERFDGIADRVRELDIQVQQLMVDSRSHVFMQGRTNMTRSQRRLTPAPEPEQIPAGFGQATSRALRAMRERTGIDDTLTEERDFFRPVNP